MWAILVGGIVVAACAAWLAPKLVVIARDRRQQLRARRWARYRRWFRDYQVRILAPELFRRWRPGKVLTDGYPRPVVIRPSARFLPRFTVDRLRHRRPRGRAGA